jgi:hypothetical protein
MKARRNPGNANRSLEEATVTVRRVALLLIALAIPGLIALLAPGAGAQTNAPRATLDTLDGTYTAGASLGRVEVLFFSFPG